MVSSWFPGGLGRRGCLGRQGPCDGPAGPVCFGRRGRHGHGGALPNPYLGVSENRRPEYSSITSRTLVTRTPT